jgi:hypothetical protein
MSKQREIMTDEFDHKIEMANSQTTSVEKLLHN